MQFSLGSIGIGTSSLHNGESCLALSGSNLRYIAIDLKQKHNPFRSSGALSCFIRSFAPSQQVWLGDVTELRCKKGLQELQLDQKPLGNL